MFAKILKSFANSVQGTPLPPLGSIFSSGVFKYDPRQARDDHGRWTASGPMGAATALAKERNIRDYDTNQVVSDALGNDPDTIAEYHAAIAQVNKDVAAGLTTKNIHSKNGDGTGGYSAERLKYHRKIMDYFFKDAGQYKPEEGEAPTLTVLGGRGGSGKSNFAKEDNKTFGVYSKKRSMVIDSDAIKEMLPEYDPSKAYLVHEESAHIADKIRSEAKKRRLNIVLDITLRSPHNHVVDKFKQDGYRTEAHFMHKSPKGALTGAVQRWNRQSIINNPITGESKIFPKGRLVPPSIIEGNVHNERNFDSMAKRTDHWSVVANEAEAGFQGRKVASRTKKLESFHSVFKANPYHDENGKFTSKEKAGHRMQQATHFAQVLSGAKGKEFTSTMMNAKVNYAKAKTHGATESELQKAMLEKGVPMDTVMSIGQPLNAEEVAAYSAAIKYKKLSQTNLKKLMDTQFPEVHAAYEKTLAENGPNHPDTKKASKKVSAYMAQAVKYGATQDQLDSMMAKAKDKPVSSKDSESKPAEVAGTSSKKFTTPKTKADSLKMNETLGEHYYTLRETLGANHPDVKGAYAEWQKSKDHLTSVHGYTKDQIGSFSSNQKKAALNALQEKAHAAAKVKMGHLGTLTTMAKEIEDTGVGKEHLDYVIQQAKKDGVTQAEIDTALHNGTEAAKKVKKQLKDNASSSVKSAASKMYETIAKHGVKSEEAANATMEFQATLAAHKHHFDSKEVSALKKEGNEHAKSVIAAEKAGKKSLANFAKSAAEFDSKDWNALGYGSMSGEGSVAWHQHQNSQVEALTHTQKSKLNAYTGSSFTNINREVGQAGTDKAAGKEVHLSDSNRTYMKAFEAVFDKMTLGADMTLRRNMRATWLENQLGIDLDKVKPEDMVGKVYREHAYSSTSTDMTFSSGYSTGSKVSLIIRAPKETKALHVKSISNHSGENEVVIGRGATYLIRKYDKESRKLYVDLIAQKPEKL